VLEETLQQEAYRNNVQKVPSQPKNVHRHGDNVKSSEIGLCEDSNGIFCCACFRIVVSACMCVLVFVMDLLHAKSFMNAKREPNPLIVISSVFLSGAVFQSPPSSSCKRRNMRQDELRQCRARDEDVSEKLVSVMRCSFAMCCNIAF